MSTIISINDILKNKMVLSANNYNKSKISTICQKKLSDFVESVDKGKEVGSENYVEKSQFKFIRTSAIDDSYISIYMDNNSVVNINPKSFIAYDLKKGDILICKDSNVGGVVKLDRDYKNYMFSAGINRLHINHYKNYIFAIMKNYRFKRQLESMVPKGTTLMHAKNLYLDCIIPFPKEEIIIDYVQKLVNIIENKENILKKKVIDINRFIMEEIKSNQNDNILIYDYPSFKEVLALKRLDCGEYTKDFKQNDFLIKNYRHGFFYLSKNNVKSGNTPPKRYISKKENLKYYWITPTVVSDNGTISLVDRIDCDNNNIKSNCALVINRTSKGGFGEYCGITAFYDYGVFGEAQHNQGIYQIKNMEDRELIVLTSLMNCELYRKYCASLTLGSKMKELKLNNILSIPYPNFPDDVKDRIVEMCYNKMNKDVANESNFVEKNFEWDSNAGILDIYQSLVKVKNILNDVIEKIYSGDESIDKIYAVF